MMNGDVKEYKTKEKVRRSRQSGGGGGECGGHAIVCSQQEPKEASSCLGKSLKDLCHNREKNMREPAVDP